MDYPCLRFGLVFRIPSQQSQDIGGWTVGSRKVRNRERFHYSETIGPSRGFILLWGFTEIDPVGGRGTEDEIKLISDRTRASTLTNTSESKPR
jgi:hypothetical protein